jgi:hypothetical protein
MTCRADRVRDRSRVRADPERPLIYAVAGLVIFAGLTRFGFQRLRRTEDIRSAPLLAASIFLDVLNLVPPVPVALPRGRVARPG